MVCINDGEYEKYVKFKERTYINAVANAWNEYHTRQYRGLGSYYPSPHGTEANFIRKLPIDIVKQIHRFYFKEIGSIEF